MKTRSKSPRALPLEVISLVLAAIGLFSAAAARAQDRQREDEIVANLAGGRVIVHVARESIIFAAIDEPIEANSIPPRVMDLDSGHIGVLFGASEWQLPADPKSVRLDKSFPRVGGRDPRYETNPDEVEPDLETIGVAFLERLRPLVAQLHHRIDFKPEEPLFELVVIGYAPNSYGAEVWVVEYRIQQEEVATRGDYWQTRILRPRFTQLYPPEKHAPRTLVETRYPDSLMGSTLLDLIQGNDPRFAQLRAGEPRFAKVMEEVSRGQAQKAAPLDAADFLRAALPLIAGKARFLLGTMNERGVDWIVPPEEPVEKAKEEKEDKDRPPGAPTLRRKPNP